MEANSLQVVQQVHDDDVGSRGQLLLALGPVLVDVMHVQLLSQDLEEVSNDPHCSGICNCSCEGLNDVYQAVEFQLLAYTEVCGLVPHADVDVNALEEVNNPHHHRPDTVVNLDFLLDCDNSVLHNHVVVVVEVSSFASEVTLLEEVSMAVGMQAEVWLVVLWHGNHNQVPEHHN